MKKIFSLLSLLVFTFAGGLFCFEDKLDKMMEDEQYYSHPSGYVFPNTPIHRFWTSTTIKWGDKDPDDPDQGKNTHTYYVSFGMNYYFDNLVEQTQDDLNETYYVRCISNEEQDLPHYMRYEVNVSKKFQNNHDGTVSDLNTGFIWTRCALLDENQPDTSPQCSGDPVKYLLPDAHDACSALNDILFAGKDNWRLPTVSELLSIINVETQHIMTY